MTDDYIKLVYIEPRPSEMDERLKEKYDFALRLCRECDVKMKEDDCNDVQISLKIKPKKKND